VPWAFGKKGEPPSAPSHKEEHKERGSGQKKKKKNKILNLVSPTGKGWGVGDQKAARGRSLWCRGQQQIGATGKRNQISPKRHLATRQRHEIFEKTRKPGKEGSRSGELSGRKWVTGPFPKLKKKRRRERE